MIQRDYHHQVPSRGVLLGTCAAVSDHSGVPAMGVRLAMVLALCVWFKLALVAYCTGAVYFRFRR